MKTLNRKTAKEIGFDIDSLPKMMRNSKVYNQIIFQNLDGNWRYSVIDHRSKPHHTDKYWFVGMNVNTEKIQSSPTNFKGDWTESLFKIERK